MCHSHCLGREKPYFYWHQKLLLMHLAFLLQVKWTVWLKPGCFWVISQQMTLVSLMGILYLWQIWKCNSTPSNSHIHPCMLYGSAILQIHYASMTKSALVILRITRMNYSNSSQNHYQHCLLGIYRWIILISAL